MLPPSEKTISPLWLLRSIFHLQILSERLGCHKNTVIADQYHIICYGGTGDLEALFAPNASVLKNNMENPDLIYKGMKPVKWNLTVLEV